MSEKFKVELKALIIKQLTTLKKKEIAESVERIGENSNGSKSILIQLIANSLTECIFDAKQSDKLIQQCHEIAQKFINKLQIPIDYSKIQSLIVFLYTGFSDFQPSVRNIRIHQPIIKNIWTQNGSIECLCPKITNNILEQPCYQCGKLYHTDCLWPRKEQELFQCPYCYLQNCIPFKEVKHVLFAGYLSKNRRDKIQHRVNFNVAQNKKNYIYVARCARLNTASRYEITWPDTCTIALNKNKLTDFKPLGMNSPLKRRNDEQLNIQKSKLMSNNELIIEQKPNKNTKSEHLLMILAVSMISQAELMRKLECKRIRVDESREILKKYCKEGCNEISIQKLSIPFMCPLYHNRIKLPVRSKHCKSHFQAFDLKNFILASINAKSSIQKWKCPICGQRSYDLSVDEYLLGLINQSQYKNIEGITFKSNGQPQFEEKNEKANQENQYRDGEYKYKQRIEKEIEIDLDLDDNVIQRNNEKQQHQQQQQQQQHQWQLQQIYNNKEIEQIDIIQKVKRKNRDWQQVLITSNDQDNNSKEIIRKQVKKNMNEITEIIKATTTTTTKPLSFIMKKIGNNEEEQNLEIKDKKKDIIIKEKQILPIKQYKNNNSKKNKTHQRLQETFNRQFIQKESKVIQSNKMHFKNMITNSKEPIQIESDKQTEQQLQALKLQKQLSLLDETKKTLSKKLTILYPINESDQNIFNEICSKLIQPGSLL